MATYTKFHDFVRALCEGEHNLATAGGHTLKVYLSNTAPTVATDAIKAHLAEISTGFGYVGGGEDTTNTGSGSGGVYTVAMTDVVWTATGGSIGPFQYVVLYNDTPTNPADPLICYWDYASGVTLTTGETFTVDFGANTFTVS